MQKKTTCAMTSIGLGMAIGGAAAAIGTSMMHSKTPMKKKAAKAIRSMEDMLDSLQYMLK
ncbi:MAG: hypothetical protein ACI4I5_10730 [Acutalibacteraceae bacterium]